MDPTWDGRAITQKKGKVTQERKKLMVVVVDGRKEGDCFSINCNVGVVWPQTASEKRADELPLE